MQLKYVRSSLVETSAETSRIPPRGFRPCALEARSAIGCMLLIGWNVGMLSRYACETGARGRGPSVSRGRDLPSLCQLHFVHSVAASREVYIRREARIWIEQPTCVSTFRTSTQWLCLDKDCMWDIVRHTATACQFLRK
jgi:hypothetical protein